MVLQRVADYVPTSIYLFILAILPHRCLHEAKPMIFIALENLVPIL